MPRETDMTLHITLTVENEARLRARAAAVGKDPTSFIHDVIEDELSANDVEEADSRKAPRSPEQWIQELREWAASHRPLPYEADDSRESIYESRGE